MEIAQCKKEIAHLHQTLEERTRDINRLIQWIQSLQQDTIFIYNSITWKVGNLVTQIVLKLLRRPTGPTARDHINKVLTTFEFWKINYFKTRQQSGLQTYMPWHETGEYALWVKQYDTLTQTTLAQMQTSLKQWQHCPVISILMPVDQQNEQWLRDAIKSVQTQIYPAWELCLIPQTGSPITFLNKYADLDRRIKLIEGVENNTRAASLNSALAVTNGDFIALMGAIDQIPNQALYKVAEMLNSFSETDLIYTDEDKINVEGQRYDPYFKSTWNPDLFYSQNILRHLTIYRCSLIKDIGGFRADYQGYEDYDLTLRFIEKTHADRIRHIPHILYHRRDRPKPLPNLACQVLQAHFQRLQQPVKVVEAPGGHTRVIYPSPAQPPLVSLIIPTRDKLDLLRGTLDGLLHQTDYKNIEIIIIDNGSVEPETLDYLTEIQKNKLVSVIKYAGPFNFSLLNNLGVFHARGTIVGLMNNDLEVISPGWLTEMVCHALRPDIGAVGAKLYYANDTIQHAGVIVGLGGMAGHHFRFLAKETPGYHWKPFLTQNYSAVTGACLIMRRKIFEEVGGLEEKHLKVAFNDVDLCLRIRERGYRIVWTPYAELYHLESASRGLDNTLKKFLRLQHELNYMKKRWGETLLNDPYYNPNLTIEYEDFSLAWPPRVS